MYIPMWRSLRRQVSARLHKATLPPYPLSVVFQDSLLTRHHNFLESCSVINFHTVHRGEHNSLVVMAAVALDCNDSGKSIRREHVNNGDVTLSRQSGYVQRHNDYDKVMKSSALNAVCECRQQLQFAYVFASESQHCDFSNTSFSTH